MVFHIKAASMTKRFKYQDNPWDTTSIGSMVSSDFDIVRSKIDLKKANYDTHQEWHVVPSGGSKARAAYSNNHPYPCRYDEYDIYLPQEMTDEQGMQGQSYEMKHKSNGTNIDNKHTVQTDGKTTSNKSSGKSFTKQNAEDKMKHFLVGEELPSSNYQNQKKSEDFEQQEQPQISQRN
jgi:hypothetical protein